MRYRQLMLAFVVGSVTLALLEASMSKARAEKKVATNDSTVQPFQPPLVVAGSPRARGLAYGTHFREGIHEFLNTQVYDAFADKPATRDEMLQFAGACGAVVKEATPMVAEEYEGIAEGSGLSFDEIMLINLHEEFYHRGQLPKPGHCTAVAVAPSDSGDDHAYVGQTWDWFPSVVDMSAAVEWQRDHEASVLAFGFPGMPTGAGMNSSGIALCWTSGGLEKNREKETARVGLPSYVLINHLLAQKDMESVIREAKRDLHSGWFTFVMNDSSGDLVNIEGSPSGVTVERSQDHLARVSYGTREQLGTAADRPLKRHARCEKMYSLLQASAGSNNLATLQKYFTDQQFGIVAGKKAKNKTIAMMVFDLTDRKAYLSRGPEFNLQWREIEFSKK